MDCSSNQRARQGARCLLDVLPAELFPLVAQLLPAADLGRTEATSRALRAAVERVVREQAAGWGGFGTGAAERVAGESWAGLSLFIELRAQGPRGCVATGIHHTLAATSTGALWAWGSGHRGKLGHGDTLDCAGAEAAPPCRSLADGALNSSLERAAGGLCAAQVCDGQQLHHVRKQFRGQHVQSAVCALACALV